MRWAYQKVSENGVVRNSEGARFALASDTPPRGLAWSFAFHMA
jgi:hypothetical protein